MDNYSILLDVPSFEAITFAWVPTGIRVRFERGRGAMNHDEKALEAMAARSSDAADAGPDRGDASGHASSGEGGASASTSTAQSGSREPKDDGSETAKTGSEASEESKGDKSGGSKQQGRKRGRKPNNVRKLRIERMMSKAELARRANLSVLTIDRVEKGYGCRMDTKRKILEALGLSLADRVRVFGEEE